MSWLAGWLAEHLPKLMMLERTKHSPRALPRPRSFPMQMEALQRRIAHTLNPLDYLNKSAKKFYFFADFFRIMDSSS